MIPRFVFCLFFVIFLGLGCITSEPEAEVVLVPYSDLEEQLSSILEEESLMGLSVAVVHENKLAYTQGFGWADLGRKIPMTAESIVRVASISKSVAATALMMLYEQGKCQLDEDIGKYLGFSVRNPHFPDVPITLRMIMSHTASIQDGEGYEAFLGDMRSKHLAIAALFEEKGAYYTADMFMNHYPGTYFTYSNASWGLLASVIESISGERFDVFCRRHIFIPLEMDASFNVADIIAIAQLAVLYRYEDQQWIAQFDNYGGQIPAQEDLSWYTSGHNGLYFGPQGGLRCSAVDLAKFMLLHINEGVYKGQRLLKASTIQQMHAEEWLYTEENGNTSGDFMFSWGLGFHRLTRRDSTDILFPDRDMLGHPGKAYGLVSDMYFDPESKSGVIFITNGSQYPYKYGLESTFYRPEEKVFDVIYRYVMGGE